MTIGAIIFLAFLTGVSIFSVGIGVSPVLVITLECIGLLLFLFLDERNYRNT